MPRFQLIPKRAIRVPVPDVVQERDFSCGAAALMAVCKYFGVGPEYEPEFVRDMKVDPRIGTHPFQIKRAAESYGLRTSERQPMEVTRLQEYLRRGHPVLLMLQAWGDPGPRGEAPSYKDDWTSGHWVVAIGFDDTGVFFEDPSLAGERGYLSYGDLDVRWHDVGPKGVHLKNYGLALWKANVRSPAYEARARRIE